MKNESPKAFKNTDLVPISSSRILFSAGLEVCGKWIIYVENEEDRLFFDVILPVSKKHAGKRKLVVCDLASDVNLEASDYPLIVPRRKKHKGD